MQELRATRAGGSVSRPRSFTRARPRWPILVLAAAPTLLGAGRAPARDREPFAAQQSAAPRIETPAFELALSPVGRYEAGTTGSATIVLVARGTYKVNADYPTRFEFAWYRGIKPQQRVVTQHSVKVLGKRAVMDLRFVPRTRGRATVAGRLKFSVCNDDHCLLEQRDLSLSIQVR